MSTIMSTIVKTALDYPNRGRHDCATLDRVRHIDGREGCVVSADVGRAIVVFDSAGGLPPEVEVFERFSPDISWVVRKHTNVASAERRLDDIEGEIEDLQDEIARLETEADKIQDTLDKLSDHEAAMRAVESSLPHTINHQLEDLSNV